MRFGPGLIGGAVVSPCFCPCSPMTCNSHLPLSLPPAYSALIPALGLPQASVHAGKHLFTSAALGPPAQCPPKHCLRSSLHLPIVFKFFLRVWACLLPKQGNIRAVTGSCSSLYLSHLAHCLACNRFCKYLLSE